jgi:hypothetical protein
MSVSDGDPISIVDVLKQLWVALLTVLAWVGKRHMDEDRQNHKALSARIESLEKDRAEKDDINRIHQRIDELADAMHRGHREILQTLLERRNGSR